MLHAREPRAQLGEEAFPARCDEVGRRCLNADTAAPIARPGAGGEVPERAYNPQCNFDRSLLTAEANGPTSWVASFGLKATPSSESSQLATAEAMVVRP